jgi:hypothetical protein
MQTVNVSSIALRKRTELNGLNDESVVYLENLPQPAEYIETIYDKQLRGCPLQIGPARKSSIGMPDHCSQ